MRFLQVYKKKALTLIEVVISLAILFIIMIPISTMAIQTVKMNKQAEDKQQATALAQKLMEKVKSISSYENITLEDGVFIKKDEDSSLAYKILGKTKGFKVEGTIKPSSTYTEVKVDDTEGIEVDGTIKIRKEGLNHNVYLNDSEIFVIGNPTEISINKTIDHTEIIFKNDFDTIKVDLPNLKSALNIIADKNTTFDYVIRLSNSTSNTIKLYCYKYRESSTKFNIINDKGKVSYFDNLIKEEPSLDGDIINRVYDINIRVSKANSYYEINSNKAIIR